jgi:hypothetical protein
MPYNHINVVFLFLSYVTTTIELQESVAIVSGWDVRPRIRGSEDHRFESSYATTTIGVQESVAMVSIHGRVVRMFGPGSKDPRFESFSYATTTIGVQESVAVVSIRGQVVGMFGPGSKAMVYQRPCSA